jgi:hypothetical protein
VSLILNLFLMARWMVGQAARPSLPHSGIVAVRVKPWECLWHCISGTDMVTASFRPKIKIAVVLVTRPTLRFVPKKPHSNYFIENIFYFFFVKVVFMFPTSFLTVDISQYYLSVPLVCVKKLVFSNISKKKDYLWTTLPIIARAKCPFSRRLQIPL